MNQKVCRRDEVLLGKIVGLGNPIDDRVNHR